MVLRDRARRWARRSRARKHPSTGNAAHPSSPAAGAGANIGVSGVAAATAAVTQLRAGRIHWRIFWWMAPPSIVGAVLGGLVSGELPGTALLIVIGVLLIAFGVDLLRPRGPIRRRSSSTSRLRSSAAP